MIQLSQNEIAAFKLCLERSYRQIDVARELKISAAAASQISKRMAEKGLCERTTEGLSISRSEHAIALASALRDGIIPEWALVGGRLSILLSLIRGGRSLQRIARETRLAEPTIVAYERLLREHALTIHREVYRIAPRNRALLDFLERYARGCATVICRRYDRNSRVSWNDGLEFILRSEESIGGPGINISGLTYLAELGFGGGGFYRTYNYSNWHGPIGIEKACVDAHLNEPESATVVSYCTLALSESRYDAEMLIEEARLVGVEEVMGKVTKAANGEDVNDPLFIPRQELEEMRPTFVVNR
jgi:hypothetical protein